MRWRATWGSVLLLLTLGAGGYFVVSRVLSERAEVCQICRRPIHSEQVFVLQLAGGGKQRTCCPRCGLHAKIRAREPVSAAWATDFSSGRRIAAEEAFYVEGSDRMTCCRPVPLREPGVLYERHWDRCLPSLIAFERESDARAFQARFGGRLLTYVEALASVRQK